MAEAEAGSVFVEVDGDDEVVTVTLVVWCGGGPASALVPLQTAAPLPPVPLRTWRNIRGPADQGRSDSA